MKDINILAIETSCDETAVAVIRNGKEVLSNIVSSQIEIHAEYGGVVPEIASRLHVENISIIVEEAMAKANVSMAEIAGIGFTQGPGLVGSLHIGVLAAKTLAWLYQKPLIPVHHILGHICANELVTELQFPVLALVVSGGHTELVWMNSFFEYELLGSTQDDAIGEAFDKVARVMGLPYPGGVAIDKLSKLGKEHYVLPIPKTEKKYDFSFSGLKSSVLQLVAREEKAGNIIVKEDLAYAFQRVAVKQLLDKLELLIQEQPPKHVVLAGGVAANSHLRQEITERMGKYPDIELTIPPMYCCTDNAAMIGIAAYHRYLENKFTDLSVGADPGLDLLV